MTAREESSCKATLTCVWLFSILRHMKRTTIWLSDQQVRELAKFSKKSGIKQAELIRRFIDAGLAKSK